MSFARFAFQVCSFNRSHISLLESQRLAATVMSGLTVPALCARAPADMVTRMRTRLAQPVRINGNM